MTDEMVRDMGGLTAALPAEPAWKKYRLADGVIWESPHASHRFETGQVRAKKKASVFDWAIYLMAYIPEDAAGLLLEWSKDGHRDIATLKGGTIDATRSGDFQYSGYTIRATDGSLWSCSRDVFNCLFKKVTEEG